MQSIDIVSKQKKQGLYLENIANTCLSEFGWPKDKTIASLKQAKDEGRIYTTISNYKQSYRIKNPSDSPCLECQESMSQSEPPQETSSSISLEDIQRDFEDFKRFSHSEILSLKAQIAPKCSDSSAKSKDRIEVVQEALIKSLHERIFSLERQLSEKQEIIRMLLDNSFGKPSRPTANEEHALNQVHAPMRSTGTPQTMPNKNTSKKQKNVSIAENNSQKAMESTSIEVISLNESGESVEEKSDNKHGKKRVIIVGDSILNGISEKGLTKKNHIVKVRPHPGATTEDLVDHIKTVARRKPNMVVLHIGSNDLTNGVNTQEKLQEVIDVVRSESKDTDIVVSSVVTRKDINGMPNKVSSLNNGLKIFCIKNQIDLIDNSNLDVSCLGVKKFHLNRKGNSYLANNFNKYLEKA